MSVIFDKQTIIDKLVLQKFIENVDQRHGYELKQSNRLDKKSLFCWVFTSSVHHKDRVPAVNQTWLKRCDYGTFFTNEDMNDTSIPHMPIWEKLNNSYLNSNNKTMLAWPYVLRNISDEYDWYYKGEDDGYVIVENLRSFLSKYDPDVPHYFGAWMKPYLERGFNSGSGYVFSRATLKLLVEAMEKHKEFCPRADYEDIGVGVCLNKLNITPEITSDSMGHHRFLSYSFTETWRGHAQGWYQEPISKGADAFHPDLIQLHHMFPQEMYMIDTMLYKIRVNGVDK